MSTKHKGGMFRVPLIDRWLVVLTGPRLVEELRTIPEEDLSFDHAVRDVSPKFFCVVNNTYIWVILKLLQVKYSFGLDVQEYPYHIQVTRNHLSRNLAVLFPDIYDEITHVFSTIVPSDQDGKFYDLPCEVILTFYLPQVGLRFLYIGNSRRLCVA